MTSQDDGDIDADRDAVLECFRDQITAMVTGDTAALDAMLPEEFTLTHMTGYEQPKSEWLAEMRAGQFGYHRIDQELVTVDVGHDTAVLDARTFTDATVYGSRATWRLHLTQSYQRTDGQWTTTRSDATTW